MIKEGQPTTVDQPARVIYLPTANKENMIESEAENILDFMTKGYKRPLKPGRRE